MFDENGETECPKCKNINPETCLFCKGHGKVDWLDLATGGKKIKVWPYYHKKGCGKIIFYSLVEPNPRKRIWASDIILLNGKIAKPGSKLPNCPHCNDGTWLLESFNFGKPIKR